MSSDQKSIVCVLVILIAFCWASTMDYNDQVSYQSAKVIK